MEKATATLSNYRQSPRKVRLVADMVRGKGVPEALARLSLLPKRAALPVSKLINSALANAKSKDLKAESLKIGEIRVDGGAILYRRRPVSRGSAHPIRKRTSHITLVLEAREDKKK